MSNSDNDKFSEVFPCMCGNHYIWVRHLIFGQTEIKFSEDYFHMKPTAAYFSRLWNALRGRTHIYQNCVLRRSDTVELAKLLKRILALTADEGDE